MTRRFHIRNASIALGLGSALLGACTGDAGPTEEEPPVCEGKGVICTFMGNDEAGLGEDGLLPHQVSLYWPQDVTIGPDGTPYVLDWNNHRVRTIVDGRVETMIGTGYLGDAPDGPARDASLNHPTHVAFDPLGRMILSAWHNSKIMVYDPKHDEVTAVCGTGGRDYGGDDGPAKLAILDLPVATAFDAEGRMLIMDQANQRIRRVDENDVITTIVGPSKLLEPIPAGLAKVCSTDAMTMKETCKLCLEAEKDSPTCAGRKPQGFQGDGGPGTQVVMYQPFSQSAPPAGRMEMGPDDVLYFTDTGNHRVRALYEDGVVQTVVGSGPEQFDRNFKGGYAGDGGPALEALLRSPTDVALSPKGNMYIADKDNDCVRKVNTKGVISTVAGRCGKRGYAGDGGPADEAKLNRPYGITLDRKGNLYIADTHNNRVRVVYEVE